MHGDQFSPGRVSFLQKPFAPQTLLDFVERRIESQGGAAVFLDMLAPVAFSVATFAGQLTGGLPNQAGTRTNR